MKNFCVEFCEALKRFRADAGKGQIAFARDLGLLQPVYARYEKGDREPTLNELCRIARVLNATPNDLLGFSSSSSAGDITHGTNSPIIKVNGNHNTIAPPPVVNIFITINT